MDRLDDDLTEEATLRLDGDDMHLLMRALDVYGFSMIVSQNSAELMQVKELAERILEHLPKPEYDA